ncbi:MAG: hypothetical protein ACKOYN_12630 [Planctomycetota bacterium]
MRTITSLVSNAACAVLTAAALGLAGCSEPAAVPESTAPTTTAKGGHDDHDHDHSPGGHDHGAGPHGGTLADWGGGKYHVEFTVDHDAKEAVVYVLGADEKTPAPVKADDGKLLLTIREPSFQVELAARPLSGEAEGSAARYAGRHDGLGIVREFSGTISGAVDGTPFAGDFEEQAHDHD